MFLKVVAYLAKDVTICIKKKMSPDQNSLKERVEELEKVVKDKSSEENKLKYAIKALEIVVKAMSSKV